MRLISSFNRMEARTQRLVWRTQPGGARPHSQSDPQCLPEGLPNAPEPLHETDDYGCFRSHLVFALNG